MQQVDNIPCLFQVVHMRQHLVLLLIGETTHKIRSIIRFHIVDKSFGDNLRRKRRQKAVSFFFIDFSQYVTPFFIIQQKEYELCPFIIQFFQNFGNIRRMQVLQHLLYLLLIAGIY